MIIKKLKNILQCIELFKNLVYNDSITKGEMLWKLIAKVFQKCLAKG